MKLFVGNLSRDVTDDDLRQAFAAYGRVTSATVVKDKFTGEGRGFGFVEMEARAEAQAAIQGLNGKELKGRRMNVDEARPSARATRPGGGERGGAGGFGNRPRGGGGGGWRR